MIGGRRSVVHLGWRAPCHSSSVRVAQVDVCTTGSQLVHPGTVQAASVCAAAGIGSAGGIHQRLAVGHSRYCYLVWHVCAAQHTGSRKGGTAVMGRDEIDPAVLDVLPGDVDVSVRSDEWIRRNV